MGTQMKRKPSPKQESPKSLPSPEWLAGMVHQVFNGLSEEERQRKLAFVDMRREEALLYIARDILEFYDAAVVALDTRAGTIADPLRYEDVFTPDEIAHGVRMGTKTKRGWANIVTEQTNIYRAKEQLVKWIDWLIFQTKEEDAANRPHWIRKPDVHGIGGVQSGKHWLAMYERIEMPMQYYRVIRMKRDFEWFKLVASRDAEIKAAPKQTAKKSLDRSGRQNSGKGRPNDCEPLRLEPVGATKKSQTATRRRQAGT